MLKIDLGCHGTWHSQVTYSNVIYEQKYELRMGHKNPILNWFTTL